MTRYRLRLGDCLEVMKNIPDNSFHAIVTDPPAGIAFMNKSWDKDRGGRKAWIEWMAEVAAECLRVLKPGGHALVWAIPRTSHWTATAWEDGGFELRDCIYHLFGSGFPKSMDISKAIDKHGGQSVSWFGPWFRQWRESNGISQKEVAALFPSKTGGLTGCVANWELGFNLPTPDQFNLICRTFGLPFASIEEAEREVIGQDTKARSTNGRSALPTMGAPVEYQTWDITAPATPLARQWDGWGTSLKPAVECWWLFRKPIEGTVAENVLKHGCGGLNIDASRIGTDEIVTHGGGRASTENYRLTKEIGTAHNGRWPANLILDEEVGEMLGEESRFFYCSKASKKDRGEGNSHPTCKSTTLMSYLCRLITPPNGIVFDPFMGSASTGVAALSEGFRFYGIEKESEYFEIATKRIEALA